MDLVNPSEQECDCEAAKARLDAFRRGELELAEVEALAAHLQRCRHCHCVKLYEEAYLECLQRAARSKCCPDQLRSKLDQLLTSPPVEH